ncbi:MAG: hypothetical protein HC906_11060 [Bacteroidales bacterium]|nr:hypothetical protein [Bacteroidales bacterium]
MTKLRLTPYIDGSSALGVFIEKRGSQKYFQHAGGNEGFSCKYYGSLSGGKGVVIMSNSDNRLILEEIANSVSYVYEWKDFYKPEIKNVIEVPDSVLSTYFGKFMLNDEPVILSKENGKPCLQYLNKKYTIFFTSRDEFFYSGA